MHIKKLEISGFKSFMDRTVIHFDHDVIGIVGPNGCGKSNIVDAIRWCMGEQSAKHLRGKAMEDVIFNGSDSRGPAGLSEVTITFDNGDLEAAATLPLEYRDYAEIAVTRRLYRDGTSEYLINKTQVRLKDVVDLFLGTGVGTKAYSIVEQGKIGLIVSARAEDRRILIEEAAGITKYKARKKAAERKMELTDQNLLRVGDRVAELERNVASLKRQAAKAERYVSYRNELEQLVLHHASHRLLDLIAREKWETGQRVEAEEGAQAARTELDVQEAELETARAGALELEHTAEQAQSAAWRADNEVRGLEADISRAKDRLAHLASRWEAARTEQAGLVDKAEQLALEREQIEATLAGLEQSQALASSAALDEHERLEALRSEERIADQELSELRGRTAKAAQTTAAMEAKLAGFERRLVEIEARRDKLDAEEVAISGEKAQLGVRRDEAEAQVETLRDVRESVVAEKARLEEEMALLRQEIGGAEKAVEQSRSQLERQRSRLRALREIHDRLEGVGDGVKRLVGTKDASLLGLVADRIEAPAELTGAFAGLLGDALQYVVTSDPERAVDLLADLATKKQGRATVVPQHARRPAAALPPIEGEGVLGPLLPRLVFAAEDADLVHALVSDALVVDTAQRAFALAKDAGGRAIVALDGTVVHPDGRISGGQTNAVAAGLVEQKREMRHLTEEVALLEADLEEKVETLANTRSRISDVGYGLDHARQRAHELDLQLVGVEQDLKRTDDRLAAAERRGAQVAQELSEIDRVLSEATHEKGEAERLLSESRGVHDEAQGLVNEAAERAAIWREQVAGQLAVVTDHKVRVARVQEQVTSSRDTAQRLGRSIDELRARSQRLEQEMLEAAHHQGETAAQLVLRRERLLDAVTVAETAQAELTEARRRFDEARQLLSERELLLKSLRARVHETGERLAAIELALQKLAIERDHLLAGVRERFRGLELATVVGDYHKLPPPDESHDARVSELTNLIDRMGPVNLDAMREFQEESARLDFQVTQKADLEKALADLRAAIAQMNRESKRLFKETFDSVNERFQALFPKMFRGGRGHLQLTNPEDMLETGLEIIAQPPGKKLASIELMSGGEKALTAVSLIFALFQHKPSPFCILDEVDAPLDEANVARYNELIRDMTDRSQFILITHIKRTMQSVDVLYGVTMQEPGVSRLVSVKVNESARLRSSTGTETAAVA